MWASERRKRLRASTQGSYFSGILFIDQYRLRARAFAKYHGRPLVSA
jgi:hypothetical protein